MRLVEGDTDSERLFALITVEIARHGGDVERGIAAAVRWVASNLPLLSLNFVLITAKELWALRYPDAHELHLLERPAGTPLEQVSSHSTRVRSEHAADRDTVVVASEVMDDDANWRPLEPGELVHVAPDLRVSSRIVIDHAPAHQLRLSDLEAKARASQS
jgi:glutamine amidotransferase